MNQVRNRFLTPTVMTLATWQLRRTWFLLLFITLGTIAAIVIVCAIPLLSNVMTTAGLRSTLKATPDSADIALNTTTSGISTPIVQNIHNQFDSLFHRYLGNAIQLEQFAVTSEDFSFYPSRQHTALTVYGTSIQQAAPHLGPIQGRLAHITSNPASEIELMMTPDTAHQLGVRIGSTLHFSMPYIVMGPEVQQSSATITAHVVGLFTMTPTNAAYWHGEDFAPVKFAVEGSTSFYQYTLLVPDNALLAFFDHIRSTYHHTDAIHTFTSGGYGLIWHYHLDPSQFASNKLDALIDQFAGIQSTTDTLYGDLEYGVSPDFTPPYPYLTQVQLSGQVLSPNGNPSILQEFRSRIAVARIPAGVFTILILSLILFFVSLMTTLLVDRQTDTVALLRSRGASRRQIFGALLLQSIGMGIIALVIGLPLAVGTVLLLSQRMLPATELDALNIITNNPLQAILETTWYALAIVLVALFTMSISLFSAARLDVLSLRRESARSTKRPLWQRFNLDVVAGIIALLGYGFSLYVTSIGTVLQGDAQVLIATPLSIIAPFFLIIGCLLLFLRLFPLLLQLGARLAARGRGAVSLLAFAQIARSPRQALRMTMLLALATAFALFTLVFIATQSQHIQEIVAYQTGADFSAQLLPSGTSPASAINQYQSTPGVLSASVGYIDQGYGGTADLPMDIRAVDAASFGRTVIWPSQASFQAARPLLSELVSFRHTSSRSDVVPAIVDQTTINKLRLHVGSFFTVTLNGTYPNTMQCLIIGVVDHIPTINTLIAPGNGKAPPITGGILVDYQTYVNAYAQDLKKSKNLVGQPTPPVINQIWLHTKGDAVSLASVRTTLENPKFRFTHLVDRRLLLATLQSDPLYLVLDGVLILGTATAFLVALVGDVLASWLSTRTRLTNFATLRALGTTPSQVASVLTWEQAIVSITGLLLGGAFGTLLVISVIPQLTFTDLNSNLSSENFYALQSALATQLTVPPALLLVPLILVGIYILALTTMVRVVSQPALSQTLHLNQD
jgi:ABC-type antimicrobial peptide transport system permease subunit